MPRKKKSDAEELELKLQRLREGSAPLIAELIASGWDFSQGDFIPASNPSITLAAVDECVKCFRRSNVG